MRIVLGVGGGIAAYKSASLLRLFTEAGHSVQVIPTEASTRFVGIATWEALSGHPVSTSVFDAVDTVNHVRLGHEADLIVVAPATADLLAKAAAGLASDLLTNTLLMARGPVFFAPAMHTEMWNHPATRANVATLRSRGAIVMEPASGRLTGKDSGPGRLPDPEDIFAAALAAAGATDGEVTAGEATAAKATAAENSAAEIMDRDTSLNSGRLAGRTVTVTAGGTREPLDPVRFLGNRSSGKQGAAIAEAALAAGARVRFIAAHMEVPVPAGVELVQVETALELRDAVHQAAAGTDVLVMSAAVADFRPGENADTKIKKRDDGTDPVITLVRNPDILREAVLHRAEAGAGASARPFVIVGFAAETGDGSASVLEYGRRKLERKGCDLLVLNQVGRSLVFGQDNTEVRILSPQDGPGFEPEAISGSKADVARRLMERIADHLDAAVPSIKQ